MKIISFAETTPALLARRKTVTRRDWKERHALSFKAGEMVQAYDKSPRVGGKKVASIMLTAAPYRSEELPDEDYEAEGFAYLEEIVRSALGGEHTGPNLIWQGWKQSGVGHLWVVRFEVVTVMPEAHR